MITRQEAISRLEEISREVSDLKDAPEEGWDEATDRELTRKFLESCGGWEDSRTAEEIIADIYAARTVSTRGADIFEKPVS